jgi:hypothetical protein
VSSDPTPLSTTGVCGVESRQTVHAPEPRQIPPSVVSLASTALSPGAPSAVRDKAPCWKPHAVTQSSAGNSERTHRSYHYCLGSSPAATVAARVPRAVRRFSLGAKNNYARALRFWVSDPVRPGSKLA